MFFNTILSLTTMWSTADNGSYFVTMTRVTHCQLWCEGLLQRTSVRPTITRLRTDVRASGPDGPNGRQDTRRSVQLQDSTHLLTSLDLDIWPFDLWSLSLLRLMATHVSYYPGIQHVDLMTLTSDLLTLQVLSMWYLVCATSPVHHQRWTLRRYDRP